MGGVGGELGGGRWEGIRTQSHTPHYPAFKFEMGGGGVEFGRWDVGSRDIIELMRDSNAMHVTLQRHSPTNPT